MNLSIFALADKLSADARDANKSLSAVGAMTDHLGPTIALANRVGALCRQAEAACNRLAEPFINFPMEQL